MDAIEELRTALHANPEWDQRLALLRSDPTLLDRIAPSELTQRASETGDVTLRQFVPFFEVACNDGLEGARRWVELQMTSLALNHDEPTEYRVHAAASLVALVASGEVEDLNLDTMLSLLTELSSLPDSDTNSEIARKGVLRAARVEQPGRRRATILLGSVPVFERPGQTSAAELDEYSLLSRGLIESSDVDPLDAARLASAAATSSMSASALVNDREPQLRRTLSDAERLIEFANLAGDPNLAAHGHYLAGRSAAELVDYAEDADTLVERSRSHLRELEGASEASSEYREMAVTLIQHELYRRNLGEAPAPISVNATASIETAVFRARSALKGALSDEDCSRLIDEVSNGIASAGPSVARASIAWAYEVIGDLYLYGEQYEEAFDAFEAARGEFGSIEHLYDPAIADHVETANDQSILKGGYALARLHRASDSYQHVVSNLSLIRGSSSALGTRDGIALPLITDFGSSVIFVEGTSAYYTFCDLTHQELVAVVGAWNQASAGAYQDRLQTLEDVLLALGQLGRAVFGALPEGSTRRDVTIATYGALALVPFAALSLDVEHSLLAADKYAVHQVPLDGMAAEGYSVGRAGWTGVADPTENLVASELELDLVASVAGVEFSKVAGSEATRSSVRGILRDSEDIYISCHGTSNPTSPGQSALHLYDGDLTAADIEAVERRQRGGTVVLSACESGVIDYRRAPTRSLGLSSAFGRAGFSTVLSTLWRVDSSATALLFWLYQQRIADSSSRAEALAVASTELRTSTGAELARRLKPMSRLLRRRGAARTSRRLLRTWRRELRKRKGSRPFEHPYFWAGVVATKY